MPKGQKKQPAITDVYGEYCHVRNFAAANHGQVDLEMDVEAYTATVHGHTLKLKTLVDARLKAIGLKDFKQIKFVPGEGPLETWVEQAGTYAHANARFHELRKKQLASKEVRHEHAKVGRTIAAARKRMEKEMTKER